MGIQEEGDHRQELVGGQRLLNICAPFWGSFCPHTNHSDLHSSFQRCPLPTKDQSHSSAMGGQSCLWWKIGLDLGLESPGRQREHVTSGLADKHLDTSPLNLERSSFLT